MRLLFAFALLLLPRHALFAGATYGTLYGGTAQSVISRIPRDRDTVAAREVVARRGHSELHLAMVGRRHPSVPLPDYESQLDVLKATLASATQTQPLQLTSSRFRRVIIDATHCGAHFLGTVAMVPIGLGLLIGPTRGAGEVGTGLLLGGGAVCLGSVIVCGLANYAFYGDLSRSVASALQRESTASGARHFVYAPPSDASDMLEFGDFTRALVDALGQAGFVTTSDEAREL